MVPKLVYDDDCRFCTWSATFAVRRSGIQPVRLSEVRAGESTLTDDERRRLPADYEECAHLVTDDAVYSCGAATERALVIAGTVPSDFVDFLGQFEDYERLRETVYRLTSDNRDLVAKVVGKDPPVSEHVADESAHPDGAN